MRRLASVIVVLGLALFGAAAGASPQPELGAECVFLPLVRSSGAAPASAAVGAAGSVSNCVAPPQPPPPTAAPAPPVTSVPQPALSGAVHLRPEHAVIQTVRRPVRWTVVLDVSGSMSANFAGQCDRGSGNFPPGQNYWQCANGPTGAPSAQVAGVGPKYYWNKQEERRIYVAKKALETLVGRLNMLGNSGYDAAQPNDQLGLVWFNDQVQREGSGNSFAYASDPAQIINAGRQAGAVNGDSYRTSGGSHVAAGLYRAALLLNAAPASVSYSGQIYQYDDRVLLITDSIANIFLDKSAANLYGGSSNSNTYPPGHPCRVVNVIEIASCQTTELGGLTTGIGGVAAGMDRPLTQAGKVSLETLRPRASVFVIALSNIPATVLQDVVASTRSTYFAADTRTVDATGQTNVDRIMLVLPGSSAATICTPVIAPDWATMMGVDQQPQGVPLSFPAIGEVLLEDVNSGALVRAPILVDEATGSMSYRVTGLAAGAYQLTPYLFYRGADGQTRRYSLIETTSGPVSSLVVNLTGAEQTFDPLPLRLSGDVCAAALTP